MNLNKDVFLDLGTGPGTQAIKFFEKGFTIIASDLSSTAVKEASLRHNKGGEPKVKFVVDDILHSDFGTNEFDFIFDMGCFHVIAPDKRSRCIEEVFRILKQGGLLFLKCFSEKEHQGMRPHRFSHDQIKEMFGKREFKIQNIKETVYQGTLNPLPKALFITMSKGDQ